MMPKCRGCNWTGVALFRPCVPVLLILSCCCWQGACLEAWAEAEVLAGASLAIDGQVISDRAAVVGHPTVKEVLAAFGRAEDALQKEDLEALMRFYATDYNYNGLKRADVRRVWGEVFEHFRAIASTHHFTELRVVQVGSHPRVELTCTGGLYAIGKASGRRVTIDSWFREVHYLVKEDGVWHFHGNAGNAPTEVPAWSAPHHPLF
ncbi:MAG: nuclear transport factor 2 family protein [Nitrospiraceae bacterium]